MKKTLFYLSVIFCAILSTILVSCKSDDNEPTTVKEQIQGRWEMTNFTPSSSSSLFDLIEIPKYYWIQETHILSSYKSDFSDLMEAVPYTFNESTKTLTANTYLYDDIETKLDVQITSIDSSNMTWNATVTALGKSLKATMTFTRITK